MLPTSLSSPSPENFNEILEDISQYSSLNPPMGYFCQKKRFVLTLFFSFGNSSYRHLRTVLFLMDYQKNTAMTLVCEVLFFPPRLYCCLFFCCYCFLLSPPCRINQLSSNWKKILKTAAISTLVFADFWQRARGRGLNHG